MAIKLSMQQAGQKAHNVALSGITNSTIVQATPGSRFAIDSKPGDIRSMLRSGDKLIINTADGKTIQIDHFFGPANKDMKSLTIDDHSAAGKKYVLGDEKIYSDGQAVTAYTPEQLKQVVAGHEYYAEQAAATEENSDVDPLWIALGLGGVALVAGTIALLSDDDDSHHHNNSASNGGDNGGGNGNITPVPSALTMDVSNGAALRGTTDIANATVMIDTDGDGLANYTVQSDANGVWTVPECVPHIPDQQNVTAWVIDANGNKIETSIVVDYHSPDLTSLSITDDLTALVGVTEANSTVALDINGDGQADYTVKADAAGNYRFTLTDTHLIPGVSSLVITDTVGNTTTLTLPSDVAPSILGVSNTPDGTIEIGDMTTSTSPTVHGLGTPGSAINIMNNGTVVGTTTVGEDGTWRISLANLPLGEHHFTVNTIVNAMGVASSDNAGRPVSFSYTTNDDINIVTPASVIRVVDNGEGTTQSITRATPDGGYIIAWAQPESAGSQYYDIKVNIYDAKGAVVKTLTLGKEHVMDGYTTFDGLDGLNNFDVAVSPVDGAITVFYTTGTPGDLSYTGTSAVYERFSADGTALTNGPQMVADCNEVGGVGGLLDSIVGQQLSDIITGVIDMVWNPIDALLQPIASLVNVDLGALKTLFTDGLANRVSSLLYGTGNFGANIVQMDDGSVVFIGTHYSEKIDSATLVERLDISGFITDFFTAIGLINQDNFVSNLIEPVFNAVMDLLVTPVENIADAVLEWADVNFGSAGSLVWNAQFAPDANGNLVQTTDFQYVQERNMFSGKNENGFISGSEHNDVMNKIAQWIFGTSENETAASQGLDATQVGANTYAVVWQKASNNAQLAGNEQPKVMMTLVDATTGKHITSDITLSQTGLAPKIVTLADGSLQATWINVNNTDSGDVYTQRLKVDNGKFVAVSAPVMVNTLTEGTQGLLQGTFKEAYDITALNNGGYVITWTSTAADGSQHLEAQLFDMTGMKMGNEMQIDTGLNHVINDSSVTVLSDGGYLVSWSETNDTSSTVMYTVFNQDGSIRASGEDNSMTTGSQYTVAPEATSLTGTDNADVIDAHLSHADVNSGAGNDRIIIDAVGINSVDGGAGFDTVAFTNSGVISTNELAKLHNIEALDLNASNESNTLELRYEDVVKITGSDKLFINGGANDAVDLDQSKWTMTATGHRDGQSYNLYTYDDDHHTQVWIQNNIQVI
ncbi:Ig-like domain-containing protein [Atlantibacter hermannii]|uniref:Ig-like domain-containing protein n=1 Tax=Atlantibacter hermannii TaxID=565 RepID=UPI0028B068CC|nr:Ig-like domain-containing protein [Atlantibacter hermannii]